MYGIFVLCGPGDIIYTNVEVKRSFESFDTRLFRILCLRSASFVAKRVSLAPGNPQFSKSSLIGLITCVLSNIENKYAEKR